MQIKSIKSTNPVILESMTPSTEHRSRYSCTEEMAYQGRTVLLPRLDKYSSTGLWMMTNEARYIQLFCYPPHSGIDAWEYKSLSPPEQEVEGSMRKFSFGRDPSEKILRGSEESRVAEGKPFPNS